MEIQLVVMVTSDTIVYTCNLQRWPTPNAKWQLANQRLFFLSLLGGSTKTVGFLVFPLFPTKTWTIPKHFCCGVKVCPKTTNQTRANFIVSFQTSTTKLSIWPVYDTQATRKSQGHGHAWLRKESTNFRFSRCMGGGFMATKLTQNGPLLTSTWSYNSQKSLYKRVSKGVTIPIRGFIPVIAILITGIGAHLAEPITTTAMITLLSCFLPFLIHPRNLT